MKHIIGTKNVFGHLFCVLGGSALAALLLLVGLNLANGPHSVQAQVVGDFDLYTTISNGNVITAATPSQTIIYTISFGNLGSNPPAVATQIDVDFPIATFSSVTWTCTSSGSAVCPVASSGNISLVTPLVSNSTLTFRAIATVSLTATGTAVVTSTIAGSPGVDTAPGNNTAANTLPVVTQTDVSITKTDGQTSAVAGSTITYTIVVTNNGPAQIFTGRMTDTFSSSLTNVQTSCAVSIGTGTGGSCSGPINGNYNHPFSLSPGSFITFTVTAQVSPNATDTLVNTASVIPDFSANEPTITDTNPGNNEATDTDTILRQADVSITKTDGATNVYAGDSSTYTITASNAGPSATNPTIVDAFPPSLTNVTWSCVGSGGGTCTASGNGDINEVVSLPSGGAVTFTARTDISTSAIGSIANTALVTPETGVVDGTSANNTATDTDIVIPRPVNLSITKSNGVSSVSAGTELTYDITVSNIGDQPASALVADTLPPSLTGVTWTCTGTGGATCTASGTGNINDGVSLPAGQQVTYVVTATVDPAGTGSIENTAIVTATGNVIEDDTADNSATDTDTIVRNADVSVTKTDGVDTYLPGDTLTYTITVANAGPSNTTASTVTDTLPAGLTGTWTCVGSAGGGCSGNGSGSINDIISLAAGGSVTYTMTTTVAGDASGAIVNSASVDPGSGIDDPNPGNNSATDTDALDSGLAITKTADVGSATPGETVTWTFTVENTSGVELNDVTIVDTLPGLAWVTGPELGTLGPGDVAAATATSLVSQEDAEIGSITNVASVSGTGPGSGLITSGEVTASVAVLIPASSIDLEVSAASSGAVLLGAEVTYTYVVTNTGSQTLTDVTLTDGLAGLGEFEAASGPTVIAATLVSGESVTVTASYVVTEADLQAGMITNSASVTATDEFGAAVTDADAVSITACALIPGEATPIVPGEEPVDPCGPVVQPTNPPSSVVPTSPPTGVEPTQASGPSTNPGGPTSPGPITALPNTGQGRTDHSPMTIGLLLGLSGLLALVAQAAVKRVRQSR